MEYKEWSVKDNRDVFKLEIYKGINYKYSQILDRKPIDCYSLILADSSEIFIRFDADGSIYGDFNEGGWVLNSCE